MDSSRQRVHSFEELSRRDNLEESSSVNLNNKYPLTSQFFLNDNQVQGPFFTNSLFKEDIDKVRNKVEDDEVLKRPSIEEGKLIQLMNKRGCWADPHPNFEGSSLVESISEKNIQKESIQLQNEICSRKLQQSSKFLEENDGEQISISEEEILAINLVESKNLNPVQIKKTTSFFQNLQSKENETEVTQTQGSNQIALNATKNTQNYPLSMGGIKSDLKFSIFSNQNQQNSQFLFGDHLKINELNANANRGHTVDLSNRGRNESELTPSILMMNSKNPGTPKNSSTQNHQQGQSSGQKIVSQGLIEYTYVDKSQGEISIHLQNGFKGHWQKNPFFIITIIKKFIQNVKELSMKFKFSQMKRRYFDLIDDKSNDYNYFHVRKYFKNEKLGPFQMKISECMASFNKNLIYIKKNEKSYLKILLSKILTIHIGLLKPDSFIKILWDFFILSLLVINVFYIPVKIAFSNTLEIGDYMLILFEDLPGWAFVMDIFMHFNTAYYSKGVISKERSKIFKHYIKGSFIWDLLIVGPFLFSSLFNVKFLNIILLFRSSKILKILSSIEELLNLKQAQATYMSLVKLVLLIIYIAHIFGCLFYYVHILQIQSDPTIKTWVVKCDIQDQQWSSLYISSVYWAVITMITLGYGDITPITSVEKIFVIFVTLFSCGIFAYAVNSIGYIIQEINKKSNEFRSKMSSLTNHMRQRELSNVMQMRVKKYFEYLHQESSQDNEDGQNLLQQCTSSLKNEVLTEMYSKVLASRKEFRLNFSKEFLMKLAPKMHESRLGPEEMIFKENEFNKKVYFLMRGNIALLRTRNAHGGDQEKMKDINIKILKKGDIFGLESFLSGSETNVAAKTLNVASLVYLKEEDFVNVIKDFENDKEHFAMIKDKLNLMKSCRGLGINCYLCDSFMHQFLSCSYMSYQPNEKKIIRRFLQNQNQERQIFQRQGQRQGSPKNDIFINQESALKAILSNNQFFNIEQFFDRIKKLQAESAIQSKIPELFLKQIDPLQESEDLQIDFKDILGEKIKVTSIEEKEVQEYPKQDSASSSLKMRSPFQVHISSGEKEENDLIKNQQKNSLDEIKSPTQNNQNKKLKGRTTVSLDLSDLLFHLDEKPSFLKKPSLVFEKEQQIIRKKNSPICNKKKRQSSELNNIKIVSSGSDFISPKIGQHSLSQLEKHKSRISFRIRSHYSFKDEDFESKTEKNNQIQDKNSQQKTLFKSQDVQNSVYSVSQTNDDNEGFMILLDFDKVHTWNQYFPHNNFEKVLDQNKKLLEKKQHIMNKSRKKMGRQTQKYKHIQQIFSNIHARSFQKNNSIRVPRNPVQKLSLPNSKEQNLQQVIYSSQNTIFSPQAEKEFSKSILSVFDNTENQINSNINFQ